jgi:hypothetical protein
MLIAGAVCASAAYIWMALGQGAALIPGVIAPQALLGISFAMLVAPLTASALSSVTSSDEALASGVNNAISRVAQLAGVAIVAGLGTSIAGWQWGLFSAAALSASRALVTAPLCSAATVRLRSICASRSVNQGPRLFAWPLWEKA